MRITHKNTIKKQMWLDINLLSLSLSFMPIPTHKESTKQAEHIYVTTSTKACLLVMQHTTTQFPHIIHQKMHDASRTNNKPVHLLHFSIYFEYYPNISATNTMCHSDLSYRKPIKFIIPIVIHMQIQLFHNLYLQSYEL